MQTQEMEYLKEIMQHLRKNVAISTPGSIRFTISLTNLKYWSPNIPSGKVLHCDMQNVFHNKIHYPFLLM